MPVRPRSCLLRWLLLASALSLSQLSFAPGALRAERVPRCLGRPANLEDAIAEAKASEAKEWPPKDWLRLSTTVASEEGKQKVIRAVLKVSEGLRLEESPVQRLRSGSSAAGAVRLALWVPPRSMLLVSSMMGEALEEEEIPMVLVEGLDVDGDAQFYRGELTGAPNEELKKVAEQLLEGRLCAAAEVGEASDAAVLHTTAAGRTGIEAKLTELGDQLSVDWTALGGNSEYLSWVEAETSEVS